MTVLLDTNVIVDALQDRQPFALEAKEILTRSQNGEFSCLFTANAAADIFYLYSKARDVKTARAALAFLLKQYGVVSVTAEDCQKALTLPIDDFEDALVVVCAQKSGAGYIITRDEQFLRNHSQAITPKELLEFV
jgi:predicted nucleic acid-binding protein